MSGKKTSMAGAQDENAFRRAPPGEKGVDPVIFYPTSKESEPWEQSKNEQPKKEHDEIEKPRFFFNWKSWMFDKHENSDVERNKKRSRSSSNSENASTVEKDDEPSRTKKMEMAGRSRTGMLSAIDNS